MYRKWNTCILILFLLTGCAGRAFRKETFSSSYDTLQTMTVPVTFLRNEWINKAKDYANKYKNEDGEEVEELLKRPYAKLADSKNHKAIIFISHSGVPVLVTIDRQHNPVDTLYLLSEAGLIEETRINEQLTIQVTDSIFSYEVIEQGNSYEQFAVLSSVQSEKYRILNTGKIKMVKQKIKNINK